MLMSRLAILANIILLSLPAYFIYENGLPDDSGNSLFVLLVFVTAILSLTKNTHKSFRLLSALTELFLKRKKLEEQLAIKRLSKN